MALTEAEQVDSQVQTIPGASAFAEATLDDFSAYVFEQTSVFIKNSNERDLKFLSYLLEMVAIEAARLGKDGAP